MWTPPGPSTTSQRETTCSIRADITHHLLLGLVAQERGKFLALGFSATVGTELLLGELERALVLADLRDRNKREGGCGGRGVDRKTGPFRS